MKTLIRIIVLFILAISILVVCFYPIHAVAVPTETEPIQENTTPKMGPPSFSSWIFEDENIDNYTLEELDQLILEYRKLDKQIGSFRWEWNQVNTNVIKTKVQNAALAVRAYQNQKDKLIKEKWNQRAEEYPAATAIWLYMKNLGWNDYVCAGIMGNIMAEVGGGTLNVQYWLAGGDGWYYGMCQWSKYYCPDVYGAELLEQCDYLRDTIQYQIDVYGYLYQSGFNYEQFLELTNERSAAYAFGVCYERPAFEYLSIRCNYAEKAYNYFVEE